VPNDVTASMPPAVQPALRRLADLLEVDDDHSIVLGGLVTVPPRLVAFDGIRLRSGLCVCRTEDHDGDVILGRPSLAVDLKHADGYRRLRVLAWTMLEVPESWVLSPDDGAVTVRAFDDRRNLHPIRVTDRLDRHGRGWRCSASLADIFATGE
jgi:hypothetical protein